MLERARRGTKEESAASYSTRTKGKEQKFIIIHLIKNYKSVKITSVNK